MVGKNEDPRKGSRLSDRIHFRILFFQIMGKLYLVGGFSLGVFGYQPIMHGGDRDGVAP